MQPEITINPINEVFCRIECSDSIAYELNDYFAFRPNNYKFDKRFRNKVWDGYIRLFSIRKRTIYKGLIPYVIDFAKNNGIACTDNVTKGDENFSIRECVEFVKSLSLPGKIAPRDYQIKAVTHAIRKKRAVIISPTASGKSFIIYTLLRLLELRTLIIVPRVGLVRQMYGDFGDYSVDDPTWNVIDECSLISSGYSKEALSNVTITTWQSVYTLPKGWFDRFECVIIDEAHEAKANSLKGILEKMTECQYRFGFTGTLDGVEVNKLTLEGLFGLSKKFVETHELMERGQVSKLRIKCCVLQYPEMDRKNLPKDYQKEVAWLVQNEKRNRFIANLALSLKGNTLVLYQYVDNHGKLLYDMIKAGNENAVFIHGDVKPDEREEIRKMVMRSDGIPMVCSYGTYSTGINIPNIHNIIFAFPTKSRVRSLQSIGRGLRLADGKLECVLFDIVDDLTYKNKQNYVYRHFLERLKIYNEEQFDYKVYNIELGKR